MSARSFELTLARLYTDPIFREEFLLDAAAALKPCDLTESEQASLIRVDRVGLVMAAKSFLHKRKNRRSRGSVFGNWILSLKRKVLR